METDEHLRARMLEKSKSRFGRVEKDLGDLGELRRQKKEPHTQVLYVWVPGPDDQHFTILRSINNCTNDELTEAIRYTGTLLVDHRLTQTDAELVLDLMYAELGKRVKPCET
jgi:hypothetical protein